jgi:hypothetical protein
LSKSALSRTYAVCFLLVRKDFGFCHFRGSNCCVVVSSVCTLVNPFYCSIKVCLACSFFPASKMSYLQQCRAILGELRRIVVARNRMVQPEVEGESDPNQVGTNFTLLKPDLDCQFFERGDHAGLSTLQDFLRLSL